MKKLLGNDFVINENDCNLSCQYCLTGQSNLKKSHEEQLIFKTPTRDVYEKNSSLAYRIDRISERIKQDFKAPFLKITGGEIFLVNNIIDYIKKAAKQYEVIVLQTNGVLIKDEHIEQIKTFNNVVFQISLDSHLHFGNSYRIMKTSLHDKVVKKIEKIIDSDIDIEIYTVINDRSITEIEVFSKWLLDKNKKITFFPFPVRGPNSDEYKMKNDQLFYLHRFIEKYPIYQSILPPLAYFKRLLRFFENDGRDFRCHLPRIVISSFSDGMLTACPNIWFSDLGNILDDTTWNETKEKVGETGLYKALLAPKPRLDACKGCFTPWDTLSMYFDDEITLDELCEAPTYSKSTIRQIIYELKQEYLSGMTEKNAVL